MIILYGSNTSPYVRRLRIWMADKPFDYVNMNIFAGKDRQLLKDKNPTLKIPMLEDDGQVIFDSGVIYRYLQEKNGTNPLTWTQENQLSMMNAATDSLIQLLLCERSNMDTHADVMFFKLQRERLGEIFNELERLAANNAFATWDYVAISLYCLIDWAEFRKLHELDSFTALQNFAKQCKEIDAVKATDPRMM